MYVPKATQPQHLHTYDSDKTKNQDTTLYLLFRQDNKSRYHALSIFKISRDNFPNTARPCSVDQVGTPYRFAPPSASDRGSRVLSKNRMAIFFKLYVPCPYRGLRGRLNPTPRCSYRTPVVGRWRGTEPPASPRSTGRSSRCSPHRG